MDGHLRRYLAEEVAVDHAEGLLDRREALRRGRAQGAEAARIARLRYQSGRESFQIVLDAERALANIDADLARSEAQLSDYLVSLFLALGGGWQQEPPPGT